MKILRGGGKQLSDFENVDWSTVELSFGQSEFTVNEADCFYEVKPADIGDLNLYIENDNSEELISTDSYSYEDWYFYNDESGSEALSTVRESGTYYVKIELDTDPATVRYVPITIKVIKTDIYNLSNYFDDSSDCDSQIGDSDLENTKSALAKVSFNLTCKTFEDEYTYLPDDATYEVDQTWYQYVDDEDDPYVAMDSYPKEYGSYAIRIIGSGQYSGEAYIYFDIYDQHHSSAFFVSSGTRFSVDRYKTVLELKNSIEISADGDSSEDKVLTSGKDYEITKIGIFDSDYEGEEDADAWISLSDSDQLQDGDYRIWIKPIGEYYGDVVTEDIWLVDLKSFDSYNFKLVNDYGNNLLLLNSDSFNIQDLKVTTECESIKDAKSLIQGTDFELENTWFQYDDESDEYTEIEGYPQAEGWYKIPVVGKGDFENKDAFLDLYVADEFDLKHYSIDTKRYLVAGEDLAISKLDFKVHGYVGTDSEGDDDAYGVERTLTYGKDYTICWGSYDSDGVFQALDGDEYPEVTEDSWDWYLKVIGQGDYSGQEIIERQIIHKNACTHSNIYEGEVEATCTEDGYTGYKECRDCGEILEQGTVIPALGHDWQEVKGTAVAATCTEDGKEADEKCSRCDKRKTGAVIEANGEHDYQDVADTAVEATCTTPGHKANQKCTKCGDVVEGEEIPALGHDYSSEVTKAPTCETKGERTYTCTRCNDSYTESISALGHTYDEGVVTTPATCSTSGVKTYTCTNDGCTETKTESIPATGKHAFKVTKPAVAATYTSTGLTEEKACSVCGKVLQKQSVIAKLSAKAQSVSVKIATKSVKKSKVKKKAQVVSGAVKVSGAKGKVTYAKVSGSGKLKVNASNGKITVKKKTKKGTYKVKIKVNVAAPASGEYKAYTKTVTVKVKVK